jgi:thymidylate synthase (FAD)
MILFDPSFEILRITDDPLQLIEESGRVCYKSDSGRNLESNHFFAAKILRLGHESVLEHAVMSVRVITSRRVSHQWVRHRLASYSQESQRYCDYRGEVAFIRPHWCPNIPLGRFDEKANAPDLFTTQENLWLLGRINDEWEYQQLREAGLAKEDARDCLPNAALTELVATMNFREWRHFFTLRADKKADPEMRRLAIPLLTEVRKRVPVLFDNILQPEAASNNNPISGLGPK